jgi:DNA-binding transcriptional LysR family regulator
MQISHRTISQLNFQHLRTFLALARLENFSRTGEQVGLSQSAVSRHISALEEALGIQLFERMGRRATLTSAGRILRARIETLMREADALPRILKDLAEGVQGDLRVGACITAANAILPQVLGLYRKKFPHVGLALQPGSSADIAESLQRGEIDLAFVASDRLSPLVTTLAEIPDDLVLFAAPDHPVSLKRTIHVKDLSRWDFIQREAPSDTHSMVTHWLRAKEIELRNLMDVW